MFFDIWKIMWTIVNPQAVLFSPRISDKTGFVMINRYYYLKAKVPDSDGKLKDKIIKIGTRFYNKKHYVFTAYIEGNDLKEVGIIEK